MIVNNDFDLVLDYDKYVHHYDEVMSMMMFIFHLLPVPVDIVTVIIVIESLIVIGHTDTHRYLKSLLKWLELEIIVNYNINSKLKVKVGPYSWFNT